MKGRCAIGVNAGGIEYYSAEMPFNDLAKMSNGWIRPWGSQFEGVPLDLDSNGYLRTVDAGYAQTIISDDNWGRYKDDKRYVVLYDGEGELRFNLNAPAIIQEEPGRIEIELQKGRAGMLQVSTNPENYLRNIRIVPLANENNYRNPSIREDYANVWEGVAVIRYLDNQKINNSKEVDWTDRPKGTTFGGKNGQSIEDIVQMSNETKTNPWVHVPHLATDEYIRKMAEYVRNNLDSSLKVYLEYSNEVWNGQFTQAQYMSALGKKNGVQGFVEYGLKSKEVFDIWSSVFFDKSRLVRVLGTQFSNPWLSEMMMERVPSLVGSVDALAVGYYVGGLSDSTTQTMSDEAILDYMLTVNLPKTKEQLIQQKKIADKYNMDLIAYEAGQHLVAHHNQFRDNDSFVEKLTRINRNPKMHALYRDMYQQWKSVGGGLLVWYRTSYKPQKWGTWGLLENTNQDINDAPKYRAFKEIMKDDGC